MVKIRLARFGRKHLPHFRIVVTPLREKQNSRAIEYVGSYSPLTKELKVNKERVEYWLSVGAQPSETVERLLIREKVLKAPKTKKTYSKTAGKKSTERAEKKAEKAEAAK